MSSARFRLPKASVSRWVAAAALLLAGLLLVSACSGVTIDQTAGDGGSSEADDTDSSLDNQVSGDASQDAELGDREVPRVSVPRVPPIVLPDLSVLSETGQLIEGQLGDLVGAATGLDVLSANCAANGGDLVYGGSDEDGSFLDVAADGSGGYVDVVEGLDITVNSDGSGRYIDVVEGLDITVNSDGSGRYVDVPDGIDIMVNVDGTGRFVDVPDGIDITINADGSGRFEDVPDGIETTVNPDGTGRFIDVPDGIDITVNPDGSWSFVDVPDGIEFVFAADGSGFFEDVPAGITITVDADGNGTYVDVPGIVDTTFTTEIGILDPDVLVVGPQPIFAVADEFPPLDKLGRLKPPCVTVIRLDADVLFDFDSDQLRPEAGPVVDRVAEALIETAKPVEVHGHTDSIGADDYNLDLSERRARSFQEALVGRGVGTEITTIGHGEASPAAPNETVDGSDNPAGRQLNRRIEIVVPE